MTNNVINLKKKIKDFKTEGIKFSVSGREILPYYDIIDFLKIYYPFINLKQIESSFGSTYIPSDLYGGRKYNPEKSFTDGHIAKLAENNINLSLTLTNHYFSPDIYEKSKYLLEKYHKAGNSVICVNDELAKQIRIDFPKYQLRASIIKNINTLKKVEENLEIYDFIVIPMDKNDDDEFLKSLPEKKKIMLFANASCAYSCPTRTCYKGFSEVNRGGDQVNLCSRNKVDRLNMGLVFFDVLKFRDMGFDYFKLVPLKQYKTNDVIKFYSEKRLKQKINFNEKNMFYLCSFPKSGRTWLRFILANYINLYFKTDEKINLNNMFEFIPNNIYGGQKGFARFRYYNRPEIPLILSTHEKYNPNIFSEKRIIFLKRNPLDTIVSYYFHIKNDPGYRGNISEFIRDKKFGIRYLKRYYKLWEKNLNNESLIISYEDMIDDIESVIINVLNFINIQVDNEILKESINNSDINNMRNSENLVKIPDMNESAVRVRKGKTNNYMNYLSEEDIKYCNDILDVKLHKLLEK